MSRELSAEEIREKYGLERSGLLDQLKRRWVAYLFVGPTLLLFVALFYYPMLRGVWLTFHEVNFGSPNVFVGLANYAWLVGNDMFTSALIWTGAFVAFATTFQLGLGLLAALLLNEVRKHRGLIVSLVMSPYFCAPLASGIIWSWFLNARFGAFTRLFLELGMEPISFLSDGFWPYVAVIAMVSWHEYAYAAIIYLAALGTIPREQYEAAAIDGATIFQRFRDITIPHLLTPTVIILATRTAWNLAGFAQIFELTAGGPGSKTTVLSILMYEEAFVNFNYGRAYAVGIVMLAISVLLAIVYVKAIRTDQDLRV